MSQSISARLRRLLHLHRWVYGATTYTDFRVCQVCGKRQIACGLLGWENVPGKCAYCRGSGRRLDDHCQPAPCPACSGSGVRDLLAESLARDSMTEAEIKASLGAPLRKPDLGPQPTYTLINPSSPQAAAPPRPAAHKPTIRRP